MSLTRIFCTRPVKWRDLDGSLRASARGFDAEVPTAIALHAISIGAAVPLDHPLRRWNLGKWHGHFNVAECLDLNASEAEQKALS